MPLSARPTSSAPRLPEGVLVPLLRMAARFQPKSVARHAQAAQRFFDERNLNEAVRRWNWVLAMQPGSPTALIGLGWALLEQNRTREAATYFLDALARRPNLQEARWLLARATLCKQAPEQLPHTTPPRILRRDLAVLAPLYNQVRLSAERVVVHAQLAERAIPFFPIGRTAKILDLGCGTGLVGESVWPLNPRLEGVDVVPGMLLEAARRTRLTSGEIEGLEVEFETGRLNGTYSPEQIESLRAQIPLVYDVVWMEDGRDFMLRQTLPSFDMILASDVFPEIGGLTPVFDGAVRSLIPGGVLVASTDPGPNAGYLPHGRDVRFMHSEAYLNEQAARVGFEVLRHDLAPFDHQRNARYSIFRKPL